jgi:hypothetical protein
MSHQNLPFTLDELGNTYAESGDRYVVSFIVSYGETDIASPEEAVARALDLTRDHDSRNTHWYVYDRKTRTLHWIKQGEAEPLTQWP